MANLPEQENEPPVKRQIVQRQSINTLPAPSARHARPAVEQTVPKAEEVVRNPFARRLVAAREQIKPAAKAPVANEGQPAKDVESIRQWRRHTLKIFPSFNFFFESIQEDTRARFVDQLKVLGAVSINPNILQLTQRAYTEFLQREEGFFSRNVTHIVTSRQIPDTDAASVQQENEAGKVDRDVPQTINPTLLDKHSNGLSKLRTVLQPGGITSRKETAANMDILVRARQMGIKIWTVDKFQRVLISLLGNQSQSNPNRAQQGANHAPRLQQEDLSQVLRKEKSAATWEREIMSMFQTRVTFKGPFIYVHDMDERTRPTMVREYAKVAKPVDGEWPQFRSTAIGKCPFLEEPATRREIEQERLREEELQQQEILAAKQTSLEQGISAPQQQSMQPPCRRSPRKALQDLVNGAPVCLPMPDRATSMPKIPLKLERQPSYPPTLIAPGSSLRHMHFFQSGGEPAASGIVRSNLTSAIQSQMISSTAANAGAKAGTSKEVHELKRKVLERGHTGSLSIGSIPSSHRMTDLAGALKDARAPPPQRVAKMRAQEKLGGIQEESTLQIDTSQSQQSIRSIKKRKQTGKRDSKPGYCENCRDKYDDFEDVSQMKSSLSE